MKITQSYFWTQSFHLYKDLFKIICFFCLTRLNFFQNIDSFKAFSLSTPIFFCRLLIHYTRIDFLSIGANWAEKQVVVTQNTILFFEKTQSFYDPEVYKMLTYDLIAFIMQSKENQNNENKNVSQVESNMVKLVHVSQKVLALLKWE